MDWEIKKWLNCIKKKIVFLIPLVFFGFLSLFIFLAISCVVFYYLGLELADLRETVDSREMGMGGINKEKLIERAFTIIGGIVGGGVAISGLLALIWRSILMGKQTEIAQEQLKISQNIRYAEQFEKSVKNLSNEDLGIFKVSLAKLSALSQEGEKEYRQVWEQLCYFLSHHKPLQKEGKKPHPKVKAIAQMLKERNTKNEDFKLDLSYAHLEGAYLMGVNLKGVNLFEAHLEGANLEKAGLENAYLRKAYLYGAKFLNKMNLEGADLKGADLRKINLREGVLTGALLGDGTLFGGSVTRQDLSYLSPKQLWNTCYDVAGEKTLKLMLPEGISEKDEPKPISYERWLEKYRPERKN